MEIDFEDIIVDNLTHVGLCLDNVVYHSQINFEKVIEAKTIVQQILQLIYLKNSKTNKTKDGGCHGVNPNTK